VNKKGFCTIFNRFALVFSERMDICKEVNKYFPPEFEINNQKSEVRSLIPVNWFNSCNYSLFAGVKRNFWLAKSLTSSHLHIPRVIFQVMHFVSGGCSLRYHIRWELII